MSANAATTTAPAAMSVGATSARAMPGNSTTADAMPADTVPAPVPSMRALSSVLLLSGLATAAIAAYIFVGLDGWNYYSSPAAVRGYTAGHQLLRPAGRVGHLFGVIGFLMMLVPVAYAIRKKAKRFRNFGGMKTWLDIHVFCGIVGPVMVTFHTSFKFGGLISVAYWSMVAVVLSGFIGRYLYNRIPRTLRGLELSQADLDRQATEMGRELSKAAVPEALLHAIERLERQVTPGETSYLGVFAGEARFRRATGAFSTEAVRVDMPEGLRESVITLATGRATLLRRLASLRRTKRLFDLWHVFHMPLVYIMFAIVVGHVGLTLYMGYVPFMD